MPRAGPPRLLTDDERRTLQAALNPESSAAFTTAMRFKLAGRDTEEGAEAGRKFAEKIEADYGLTDQEAPAAGKTREEHFSEGPAPAAGHRTIVVRDPETQLITETIRVPLTPEELKDIRLAPSPGRASGRPGRSAAPRRFG